MAEQALTFRVLDLTDEAAVYGARLMADFGADVIKIESPFGDRGRRIGPFFHGDRDLERSLYFQYMNTNKRGITLDLETSAGREVFKELVKTADVVMESYPVGYMAGLGLGYEELSRINPKLVMTSITPFGQTGPYRHFKGSGIVGWAMSGTLFLWGLPDRAPLNVPGGTAMFTATNAVIGTMAALHARRTIGKGQHVDISQQESVLSFTTESGPPKYLDDLMELQRSGSRRAGASPGGYFKAKDGACCVVLGNPQHWDRFAEWAHGVTGDEMFLNELFKGTSIMQRWTYHEIIDPLTESVTSQLPKQELFQIAMQRSFAITPVNTVADLMVDPQLKFREYWAEVDHPEVGKLTYPGAPAIFSETPWSIRRPAPRLGQHNEEIYVGELGLSKEVVEALKPVEQTLRAV